MARRLPLRRDELRVSHARLRLNLKPRPLIVLNGTRASDGRFAVAKQKSPADGAYRRIVSHNKRLRSVTPERRVVMLGSPGVIARIIEHVV